MSLLDTVLIAGTSIWTGVGFALWVGIDSILDLDFDTPPKTWKKAIILPFCGPVPIIILLFAGLGNILAKRVYALAKWMTK